MKSDFIIALTQLAAERNLPREVVLSAIEAALVSAYRRDSVEAGQDISVKLDPGTGDISVYIVKTVVDEVEEPDQQLTLEEAKKIKADAVVGDIVPISELPHTGGRIAAQTAKQVVMQRLREAERELVFEEYADKEGEVFTVSVQRIEPQQIIVELGRGEAILPLSETGPYERYRVGLRLKVLLQSVRRSNKGPEIIVSRADKLLIKRLFEMEVPEIYNGSVEIKVIAREPGFRSKVAVWARQDGVDAVGSCVGLRGIRIQNIVNELSGEKVDVVQWDKDPAAFIVSALSPAQVLRVDVDVENQAAVAIVPDRQLSLAIGKEGQNARLAARLTGLSVDIKSDVEARPVETAEAEAAAEAPTLAVRQAEEVLEAALEATESSPQTEEVVEKTEEVAAEAVEEVAAKEEPAVALEGDQEKAEGEGAEPEIAIEEQLAEELIAEEAEAEAVPVGAEGSPISDLSEDIWAVRGGSPSETGVIRFAEDIAELGERGPRRGRRSGGARRGTSSARGRRKSGRRR